MLKMRRREAKEGVRGKHCESLHRLSQEGRQRQTTRSWLKPLPTMRTRYKRKCRQCKQPFLQYMINSGMSSKICKPCRASSWKGQNGFKNKAIRLKVATARKESLYMQLMRNKALSKNQTNNRKKLDSRIVSAKQVTRGVTRFSIESFYETMPRIRANILCLAKVFDRCPRTVRRYINIRELKRKVY